MSVPPVPPVPPPPPEVPPVPAGPGAYPPVMYPPAHGGYPAERGLPGAYPAAPPTNTMAILSLVMAFVFPILGVVFGHKARRQIAVTGEGGSGMATAGLVISYVSLGFAVLYVGFLVLMVVAGVASS